MIELLARTGNIEAVSRLREVSPEAQQAKGNLLDAQAVMFGMSRGPGESDDDFRNRIVGAVKNVPNR